MNKILRKKKIDIKIDEYTLLNFNSKIEEKRKTCDSYIESIAAFCEEYDYEIEDVMHLISTGLKKRIYDEEIINGNVIDTDFNLILED